MARTQVIRSKKANRMRKTASKMNSKNLIVSNTRGGTRM